MYWYWYASPVHVPHDEVSAVLPDGLSRAFSCNQCLSSPGMILIIRGGHFEPVHLGVMFCIVRQ